MPGKIIYMDNNATTPIHPEVKKAMIDTIGVYGNPSSLHEPGREARQLVEAAREKIAAFIGASPEEVMFVGSGSEANNTVLSALTCQRMGCAYHRAGLNKIVTTTIEHPCVLETSKCLQEKGVDVSYLDVDRYGKIDIEQLKEVITDNTGLVFGHPASTSTADVSHENQPFARACQAWARGCERSASVDVIDVGVPRL